MRRNEGAVGKTRHVSQVVNPVRETDRPARQRSQVVKLTAPPQHGMLIQQLIVDGIPGHIAKEIDRLPHTEVGSWRNRTQIFQTMALGPEKTMGIEIVEPCVPGDLADEVDSLA